jgi:hypothetical protein
MMYDYTANEYTASSKIAKVKSGDETFVYALVCPLTNMPFYIGKTCAPQQRLETHILNHPYCRQIAELEDEYIFTMCILERCTNEEYDPSRETYYVLVHLDMGCQLTNINFPTRVTGEWMEWLDAICAKYGWRNRKTHNNRVLNLPDYMGGE